MVLSYKKLACSIYNNYFFSSENDQDWLYLNTPCWLSIVRTFDRMLVRELT
jgi:hypothetical protein